MTAQERIEREIAEDRQRINPYAGPCACWGSWVDDPVCGCKMIWLNPYRLMEWGLLRESTGSAAFASWQTPEQERWVKQAKWRWNVENPKWGHYSGNRSTFKEFSELHK